MKEGKGKIMERGRMAMLSQERKRDADKKGKERKFVVTGKVKRKINPPEGKGKGQSRNFPVTCGKEQRKREKEVKGNNE